MNKRELRQYEMMLRVRDFGIVKTDSFASGTLGRETLDIINESIRDLADSAAASLSDTGNARQGSTAKAGLRAAIKKDLIAISRTARAIAEDLPELKDKFRLQDSYTDQGLLAEARAFISNSESMAAEFYRHELPNDFFTELASDVEKFEKLVSDQQVMAMNKTMTEADIDAALERGLKAVRRLDAIVKNKFDGDSAVLAAWTRAKHIEKSAPKTPPTPATT